VHFVGLFFLHSFQITNKRAYKILHTIAGKIKCTVVNTALYFGFVCT